MTPCSYIEKAGCDKCDQPVYKNCQKFIKAHLMELSKNIVPFKYKSLKYNGFTAFSNSFDTVKSLALDKAYELNLKIKVINLNQLISLAVGEEEVDSPIYLVDCTTKTSLTSEKLGTVVSSFVDKCDYKGIYCFLFKPSNVVLPITHIQKL